MRRYRITTMKGVSIKDKNMVMGFKLIKMGVSMRGTFG